MGVDLVTKWYMFSTYFDPVLADASSAPYGRQQRHYWVEGIFGIETSTNAGALFGLGQGYSWLFALFSILALVGIVAWIFFLGGFRDRWLTFALGMVSGGILGNLYDRVGLGAAASYPEAIKNSVRDWILFNLDGVRFFDPWPNFNIADVLLVTGAIMLFVHALFFAEHGPAEEQAPAESN